MPIETNPMTHHEEWVWSVLKEHIGKDKAIKRETLVGRAGLRDRQLRRVIASLVDQHKKPIGSIYNNSGGGYFIIANSEESEAVCQPLHSHALAILLRESVLKKLSVKELLKKYQAELSFEEVTS